ncbi:hypothetical protein O0I10_004496 [Lichtheimia ornata]|nr:uncharacterized protein O0I10_004496 [Lichtheimia ornata]KAJ8659903.1 hypothetical protein O0I10_004496 [Lichtheimia ornata]
MLMKVEIPASVYQIMLAHALSTEKEEIIGMLIGEWQGLKNTNPFMASRALARIHAVSLLTRSDKRKDRVEIAPEQLHLAACAAEELSKKMDRTMCVIGWYHSHPHITVFPSHVDLRTQQSYQYMDSHFLGLIISCFDERSDMMQRVQITCFQAEEDENGQIKRANVPIEVVPEPSVSPFLRETFLSLPRIMYQEHKKEYEMATKRIQYENSKDGTTTLPEMMTQLHNTGVYGQSIVHLVDNVICPATQVLEDKAIALQKQIDAIKREREQQNSNLIDLDS